MALSPTLLAKTALLAAGSISSHITCTPPNSTPHAEERAKYDNQGGPRFGEAGFTISHAAWLSKSLVHIVNATGVAALLAAAGTPHFDGLSSLRKAALAQGPPATALVVGTALMAAAAALRAASYRQLGHCYTFELAIRREHKLATRGPYAAVRHPGYASGLLYLVGVVATELAPRGGLFTGLGLWRHPAGVVLGLLQVATIVHIAVTVFLRVGKEDAALEQEFGDEWKAWARRTPYRLVPGIY